MSKAEQLAMPEGRRAKGVGMTREAMTGVAPEDAPAPAVARTKAARVIRVPLTVKVSEAVYKRLREASFREEVDKQDLVDQALDALLTRLGY
jgi:hypothetical protein